MTWRLLNITGTGKNQMRVDRLLAVCISLSVLTDLVDADEYSSEVRRVCQSEVFEHSFSQFVEKNSNQVFDDLLSAPSSTARSIVKCIRPDIPNSMLVSYSLVFDYGMPDSDVPVKFSDNDTNGKKNVVEFQECIAKLAFYRCLVDDWFYREYSRLAVSSGNLVYLQDPTFQRLLLNGLVSRLPTQLEDDQMVWRTALQTVVLARLFQFEEPGFVALDREEIKQFCNRLVHFVRSNQFIVAPSRFGWQSSPEGSSLAELPFLVPPQLPHSVLLKDAGIINGVRAIKGGKQRSKVPSEAKGGGGDFESDGLE